MAAVLAAEAEGAPAGHPSRAAIEGEPEGDDLAVLDVVGVAVSAAVGGIRLDPHPQLAPGLAPVRGALVDGGEPRLSVAPGWGPEIQWQSQSPLGAMVRAGPMARGQAAPKVCRKRFSIEGMGGLLGQEAIGV